MNDAEPQIIRDAATGTLQGPAVPLMRMAALLAVGVATSLAAVKLVAWFHTDSVALLSSLVDSSLDMLSSFINLLAIRAALMPHDREHRFGHGKAEPLAGLLQVVVISVSVLFVLTEAIPRLFDPLPVTGGEAGIAVMLVSIAATAALVLVQRMVIRRTGSIAVSADSLHYKSDLLMNLGVIAALVMATQFGMPIFDPIFALVACGYVLYSVVGIARQSYDMLMDREFPEPERRRIREIAMRHPDVLAVHDMRTRSAGVHSFIQLHIELPAHISLKRAHIISDEVEDEIRRAFPETDVIIHQDPEGVPETRPQFV